ncbi:MAG: hypothetical protein KGZ25_08250, partial [Planctomycetes bacterium]|nr:hypothetical protein [Planctomycetota bacterium]
KEARRNGPPAGLRDVPAERANYVRRGKFAALASGEAIRLLRLLPNANPGLVRPNNGLMSPRATSATPAPRAYRQHQR